MELGEDHGQRLLEAVRDFVEQRREYERQSGNLGLKGVISNALFEVDALRGDDDLLSRVLVGLVFGFVPTVYGNALQVLALWLGDETLWRVQQHLLTATDALTLADKASILRGPLERAMQVRAVPPLLHRTVTVPSKLGAVDLQTGDRVVVAVAAMTQEMLGQGKSDLNTVFGGDRNGANPPTHACPGSHIAMGVLSGLLTAILEVGTLTPTPALLNVRVTPRAKPQPVSRSS